MRPGPAQGVLSVRLRNQKLAEATAHSPEDVVAWFGAMQAQDYAGAKWAVALRARNLTDADVEAAFADGRILRTHVLRPTWHFVAPDDIQWMLALTAPRVQAVNRSYGRSLGLDDRTFTRARVVIERALEGGRFLTRDELAEALQRARILARGQRLAHLVMDVELSGSICSGPRRGQEFTYGLIAERAPRARKRSRDEAVAELTRRYFQSHGPATLRDFAWWSGLTMADARDGVGMVKPETLDRVPQLDAVPGAHYLLPNYDEYLIAYKDRGAVIQPSRARNLGVFTSLEHPHHVIVNGRLAGSWRRIVAPQAVQILVKPYERLSRAHVRALSGQAKRYGAFLQRQCGFSLDESGP